MYQAVVRPGTPSSTKVGWVNFQEEWVPKYGLGHQSSHTLTTTCPAYKFYYSRDATQMTGTPGNPYPEMHLPADDQGPESEYPWNLG